MSRYDKYDPISGGFRAPLAANFGYTTGAPNYAHADLNKVWCVSLNSSGQVVLATPLASTTGIVGILILTAPKAAGEVVDIMTEGEVVEFTLANGAAAAAGTAYFSAAAGDGSYAAGLTPGATISRIGHTVEATRLIVRVDAGARAAT
jgi:hypothetical protein